MAKVREQGFTAWTEPFSGNPCDHYATNAARTLCERCGATRQALPTVKAGSPYFVWPNQLVADAEAAEAGKWRIPVSEVHTDPFDSCYLCNGEGGRPMPTQESLRLRGALEALNRHAEYINGTLLAGGVIDRDQQHGLLWDARVAYLVLHQALQATPLWEGHDEPRSAGMPLGW